MSRICCTARVVTGRLLELPESALDLKLMPGEEVQISLDREERGPAVRPNEKALAALRELAERQKDRPYTDGSDTLRLLREARSGAMYGDVPTE